MGGERRERGVEGQVETGSAGWGDCLQRVLQVPIRRSAQLELHARDVGRRAYRAGVTPAEIAEEVEVRVSDTLADLAMIGSALRSSDIWNSAPTHQPQAPLRVYLGDRWLGGWSVAEWRSRLDGYDSPGMRSLTQQWIVTVYSRWEEVDRKKLQAAGDSGNCDLFGDLRNLRNDIVHHDAIATSGNAGRCKILTHFGPGGQVFLATEDFVVIMDELAAWVESLGGTSQGRVHRDPEGRHK